MNKQNEFVSLVYDLIKDYGSSEQAYQIVLHHKAPKPLKKGKKTLCRTLRILMRKGY